MKTLCILAGILVTINVVGCSPGNAEADPARSVDVSVVDAPASPEQAAIATVASMLELAEAGKWDSYVDQFYGETHKFRGPEDRATLITRFEERWGEKIVKALRRAATLTPTIDIDGRALFADTDEIVFMLYKHNDGRWTFHL